MGKKDGSQEVGFAVSDSADGAVVVLVVGDEEGAVPEGFSLTGRSGWSLGLVTGAVGVGTGVMACVVPAMVVVDISSWLSSSCSDGIGRSFCFDASIDSPNSFRCQSMNVPLCALTSVSLTMIVQVPIPDSPLKCVSIYVRIS